MACRSAKSPHWPYNLVCIQNRLRTQDKKLCCDRELGRSTLSVVVGSFDSTNVERIISLIVSYFCFRFTNAWT